MPIDGVLEQLRAICLALPDTKETLTWGQPHFRVGDKIFTGYSVEQGRPTIAFKLEMDHADLRVQDPRFWRAPYVGHKGWVSLDARAILDRDELASLLHESYRLVASKKSLAKLDAAPGKAAEPTEPAVIEPRASPRPPAIAKPAKPPAAPRKPVAKRWR